MTGSSLSLRRPRYGTPTYPSLQVLRPLPRAIRRSGLPGLPHRLTRASGLRSSLPASGGLLRLRPLDEREWLLRDRGPTPKPRGGRALQLQVGSAIRGPRPAADLDDSAPPHTFPNPRAREVRGGDARQRPG